MGKGGGGVLSKKKKDAAPPAEPAPAAAAAAEPVEPAPAAAEPAAAAPAAEPVATPESEPAAAEPAKMAYDYSLTPHSTIAPPVGPVLVCIMDGFGENEFKDEFNATHVANTPTLDALRAVPDRFRSIKAHGTAVGLPTDADMGNSEVGHNALGSGQVVDQGARLVDIALETGKMYEGAGWKLISEAFDANTVHFIGLLSDGGVHSRANQLVGCLRGAAERGAKRLRCHILTDGRDVPDGSSVRFVEELEAELASLREKGCDARIASGGGRMQITMDRYEADWSMVKRGWDAHVLGQAPHTFKDAKTAVITLRGSDDTAVSDQYIAPFVIVDEADVPVGTIEDGDAVVLFNFRADRMVEISKALEYESFSTFDRVRHPKGLRFVGMMQYDGDLKLPANFLVPPPEISHVSGEYMVKNGLTVFATSETQKFGHVTFFWNGNRSGYLDAKLEQYLEIPSDNIEFNHAPDMKAFEITAATKEALTSGKYKVVRANFANPDMVGHTGDLAATVRACETVDKCVKELLEVVDSLNGRWLLTSDHGNADDMVQRDKKGKPLHGEDGKPLPLTSHTLAPVPIFIGGRGLPDSVVFRADLPDAGLANVAATTFNLLGFESPAIYKPTLVTA
ncbi:2,3-bisphosphoglycerate-independent phosphoglycerate mutase [Tetrabaena socialis]|uniref:phosphoglycerate mutase (2,3-diphosphoglycerate-independent) n=1 Tax=Tetrabaena socialis TaxID=47790 RepID=A0A2J7ZR00_9CHLO|nr:2,3-bisphosphoglycerate-independent phosphoglycerate mutase [Tetrabaena socialis]|eukprot:PNH02676.1 2,3-bisphosphoglycerate-independent phosphoglycerate mutase [Tetrabaena socialis]